MIHSINRAHAQKSIEHMVMVLLGFEGSMIPTKMDFMLRMFFGGGKKNHKIFAKDLAGNADSRNMVFLSVISIWKITSVVDNGLPRWCSGKESTCRWRRGRDLRSLPGSGRCSGVGNGNPPQYSCLEISMGRGAW